MYYTRKFDNDFICNFLFAETNALRLIKVVVPEYIFLNKPASLECQYDLENDKLYTVQWYKDNDEFYRFVPKYVPPHISYRIDDIKVDVSIYREMERFYVVFSSLFPFASFILSPPIHKYRPAHYVTVHLAFY